MNGAQRSFTAGFIVLVAGGMLAFSVTSAGAQDNLATPKPTAALSPTPTLTAGGQIAQKVNGWQKELADPSLAIIKYVLTLVVLAFLIGLVIYVPVRLIFPAPVQKLVDGIRSILSRLREEQIVIAEFENAADRDSDFLAKVVKARMAEELRENLRDSGDLGRLRNNFKDRNAERNIEEKQLDKTGEFFDDLVAKVGNTEIKMLALIVRWLFPVQGTRVSGHLVKVGASPQNHGLVVELTELTTEGTSKTHTFWGSLLYPRFPENASLPARAIGKKPSAKPPQKAEYQLGLIYENKGFYADAKTQFESAVKNDPASKDAIAALERVLDKEEANAAKIYCELTKKAAQWVGCHIVAGGLPKSKLDPENKSQVLNYLGILYTELQAYDEAVVELKESIILDKNSYFPYWNLGNVYSYLGKQADSIKAYDQALALAKKAPDAKEDVLTIEVSRACSLWASGKEDLARKFVDHVAKSAPLSLDIKYGLACFYSMAGIPEKAFRWLRDAARDGEFEKTLGHGVWTDPDLENIRGEKEFKKLFP